jgi:hypothetical protein
MTEQSENDDAFDTELFVEELHNLPCTWNYTSNSHSNCITKAKAWESLFIFNNRNDPKLSLLTTVRTSNDHKKVV